MRRRDLLGGVWKRVEEHRAELRAQRIADRKRETAERLDAGEAIPLPKYEQTQPEDDADDKPER